MVLSNQQERSDLLQKVTKKDLDLILDPLWEKEWRSDHFPKKGSRSGYLDPGSKDPIPMQIAYMGAPFVRKMCNGASWYTDIITRK